VQCNNSADVKAVQQLGRRLVKAVQQLVKAVQGQCNNSADAC